jgi:membrane fusion protein (multidrug efflux system)
VTNGRQIILKGLDAGDQFIVTGLTNLRPGAPVKITNDDAGEGAN